ncbi:MAG: HD domain-containing protein [Treponema sp.]|nr:HD domain-containing protein [Treponema sp.]MBQ7881647.1 HD domain-containing protein [Treponema sp.]
MPIRNESFFEDNIVNVNKKVSKILFCTIPVPIVFAVFSAINIWIVPHSYSLCVFLYSTILSFLYWFLIKKDFNQLFLMYMGIFATSGFVFLLGYEGIITITVSFAFPPFITCLYYNRRITRYTTIVCFILSCVCYWTRSYRVPVVLAGADTPFYWFVKNIIGLVIEYVFLFILTDYMATRTHNTLQKLVRSMESSEKAYRELKDSNRKVREKNNQLAETQFKIIQFVAQCLGSHDLFTGRHIMHTQKYVEVICNEMVKLGLYTNELTSKNIELFKNAAFLHDIGKIHVPEGILNKIGKFTDEEFDLMKCHTTEGKNLLEFLPMVNDGRFNEIAKQMAHYHHEKWDGSGYPNKIAGIEIPLSARIMAAADVMDALLSQRLYKEPKTIDEAIEIFESSRDSHFESCIVDAVISCKDKIAAIDAEFKNQEASTNAAEQEWWQRYHENLKENK